MIQMCNSIVKFLLNYFLNSIKILVPFFKASRLTINFHTKIMWHILPCGNRSKKKKC